MTTFKATTEGADKLGLRAVLDRYANDQWLPDYYNEEQRVGIVLDQFTAKPCDCSQKSTTPANLYPASTARRYAR